MKSTTPAEREVIWMCFQSKGSIQKVVDQLNFSRGKVRNAIEHYKKHQTFSNINRTRKRKTTEAEDRILLRMSKQDPFATSTQIRASLEADYGIDLAARTVRKRLQDNNLRGCIARKKPHLSKANITKRIAFAREHIDKPQSFWDLIVWSDESKFNLFGNDGVPYVRRPPNQALNPRYTRKTVKYGGCSIMVWGCFTSRGVGPIVQIEGIMNAQKYISILAETLSDDFTDDLPLRWIFQHDNDPKHTARIVRAWLEQQKISVLSWPAQSPDLNPIENLWGIIKQKVAKSKPTNKATLWTQIKEAWYQITPAQCAALTNSMARRCGAVLRQKGYPTKY